MCSSDLLTSTKQFTRNAVIGRVHRLGLDGRIPQRLKPSSTGGVKKHTIPARPPSVPLVRLPRTVEQDRFNGAHKLRKERFTQPPTTSTHAVQQVDGKCQWITGDVRATWTKCNHPARENSNWCDMHHRLAYKPHDPAARGTPDNIRRW